VPHQAEPVVGASPAVVAGLDHWRTLPVVQQPVWPDSARAAAAAAEVAAMPPLVFAGEIDQLRAKLAAAAAGSAFVLQGGDCAETFVGATADQIRNRIKTLLQMAVVLTYGASMPVVKMGRMAGQFAKPRSSDSETRGGETLPAYRGDMVNGYDFTPESRTPDPARLVRGYHTAASTLNLVRAFTQGGFADLREVHSWNRGFAANPANQRYEGLAREIDRAIKFMEAAGADFEELKRVDLYTAHEGLLLEYERAMTRIDSRNGTPVDTSAHFVWVGERTRDLDGAHIDFFSRIRNPIGVKLGPTATPDDLERLIDVLDPEREPGRLTFITRMGAGRIRDALPPLLEAVLGFESTPLWITDPMHGNGLTTPTGYKTRRFDDVVDEVQGFFAAHRAVGTFPGGIHIELTGDDVTECLGGSEHIDEQSLATRYESLCDPRLNHMQSLELAFLVAEELGADQWSAEALGEAAGTEALGGTAAAVGADASMRRGGGQVGLDRPAVHAVAGRHRAPADGGVRL
jgi:3-deoxy-7-phosphoheptulonate synthase